MISIKSAKYLKDYKIKINFSDKKIGEVDLKQTIFSDKRPVFSQLKDLNNFKNFKVDYTIVWSDSLDLSPEFLYFKAFKDNPGMQKQFEQWGYIHK